MKKALLLFLNLIVTTIISAQEYQNTTYYPDGESLEDKIQNPIANLASIPIDYKAVLNTKNENIVTIKPILPVKITKNWLLILQPEIPISNTPTVTGYQNGIGNTTLTGTVTKSKQSSFSWGVGPTLMFPAVNNQLGNNKLSIGPSVIALKQNQGFTYGVLLQNYFSVAGSSHSESVNLFHSQIILSKTLKNEWYIYSNPEISANWKASDNNRWTLPLGVGAGKLIKSNRYLPINLKAGVYKYIQHPTDADWQIQIQAAFIIK
ncbi:neuromedin U [Bizionia sp. KMM 8389]